ncbi:MAG TPA: type II secretion system protein GspN [Terriglobales bacterium]|nr:type II secretion system protein GspN [Terriglobales bacterium]
MQMPRLTLPRFGALADRAVLGYVLYTLVLFLVFLVVTFPHSVLVRRGLSLIPTEQGVSVDFEDARFAWHRGLELTNVRVTSTALPAPYLEFSKMWLRPVVGDLVSGNWRSLAIEAEAYGGSGTGFMSISKGVVSGIIQLDGMSLGRYSLLRAYLDEGNVGGRLSARLDFKATGEDFTTANGNGDITLSGASIEAAKVQGMTIPDLHFDETKLSFSLQGDRFDLKELVAKGKELNVEANGQVSLRQPVADSMLNLRAVLNAGEQAPDSIKGLLALLPKQPGGQEQAIRITGPLGSPKVR